MSAIRLATVCLLFSCQSSTHRLAKVPDETWMLKSCMGKSNVVLQIDFCKTDQNIYRWMSGHFVSLVGFREEKGERVVLIHDPGVGSGLEKKTEPCRLVALPADHSFVLQTGESVKAEGYFKLDGLRLKKGANLAINESAIAIMPADPPK